MTTFFMPLALHFARSWREQMRDKVAFLLKCFFVSFFTSVMGFVFFQLDEGPEGIQDRSGLLFFLSMNQAFGSVIGTAQIIPRQLAVVNRERASRLYHVFPFYMASLFTAIPVEAVPQVCSSIVIYHLAGLRGSFWVFCSALYLENIVGISLGMVLSATFRSVTMAPQIAPLAVILFLIGGGFIINAENIPIAFAWLKEVSFIRYALRILMINEFKDVEFDCPPDVAAQCVPTGMDVLESLSLVKDSALSPKGGQDGEGYLILASMIVILNMLAFAVLVMKRPKFLGVRHAEKTGEHVLALDEKSNGSDKPTSAGSFDGPVKGTPEPSEPEITC
jgi:ATP-binding cassette subfamily G (WHITE) protein 2